MNDQQAFAEVNGAQLHYEIAGSGHPLVLLHGFTLDTRMWDDQFEAFARNYQVIRYDMRGFGKSALPTEESYSAIEDLKALLKHLRIDSAYLMAQSRGGAVAIDFALTYPEVIRALVLVDSVVGGHSWLQEPTSAGGSIWTTARDSGIEAAKAQWLAKPLFASAREKPVVATRLAQIISDYSGWHLVNSDPGRALDPRAAQRLHEISAPTLIIVGEHDLPDFHMMADTLEQIPNAHKIVFPGVGHMSNMENPAKFNEVVLNFLAGI
jgi:3-oxoadipate enol-lactonase